MTPVAVGVWAQRTFVTDRQTDGRTDRQTDRQTDGFAVAIDEHCKAMFVRNRRDYEIYCPY